MKIRLLIAAFITAVIAVFAGAPAMAVTGGNLTNDYYSYPNVAVRAYYTSTAYWNISPGYTTKGTSIAGKVQGFRIPSNCDGRSQYTPAGGGYPYKGGVYYPYSSNNLDLVIKVVCNA